MVDDIANLVQGEDHEETPQVPAGRLRTIVQPSAEQVAENGLNDVVRVEAGGEFTPAARSRQCLQPRSVSLVDGGGGRIVAGLELLDQFIVGEEGAIQHRLQNRVGFIWARGGTVYSMNCRTRFESMRSRSKWAGLSVLLTISLLRRARRISFPPALRGWLPLLPSPGFAGGGQGGGKTWHGRDAVFPGSKRFAPHPALPPQSRGEGKTAAWPRCDFVVAGFSLRRPMSGAG